MNENLIYVGIDYHKNTLQVCALDRKRRTLVNRSVANDWRDIVRTVEKVVPEGMGVCAAIEACSGAANLAEELSTLAHWSVDLGHPGYIARMKRGSNKTDFGDAKLLADLRRSGYLPIVWQAPHYIIELRRLVNHRHALVKQRRNAKLRVRALLRDQRICDPKAGAWSRQWRRWLDTEAPLTEESRWIIEEKLDELDFILARIARVERRLSEFTREDPVVAALMEERGVGAVTAWVMRAHIGRFDRFSSGKQLACFCGTSPRNSSSGQRQATSGLETNCDRYLRATLIEAAQRIKRFQPRWATFASTLYERGKKRNVVTAAVANRWLRGLYHRMKPIGIGC